MKTASDSQFGKCMMFKAIDRFVVAVLLFIVSVSCGSEDTGPNVPQVPGKVIGTVKDEMGGPYPGTKVSILKGNKVEDETKTNTAGDFDLDVQDTGTYQMIIVPPLSTKSVTGLPMDVSIQADKVSTVEWVIQPQYAKAHLNFGNVQIIEEIKDKDGNTPFNPDEPLYAANIFDEPIGQLTLIKAPNGNPVKLSDYQTANGNLLVRCDGKRRGPIGRF